MITKTTKQLIKEFTSFFIHTSNNMHSYYGGPALVAKIDQCLNQLHVLYDHTASREQRKQNLLVYRYIKSIGDDLKHDFKRGFGNFDHTVSFYKEWLGKLEKDLKNELKKEKSLGNYINSN